MSTSTLTPITSSLPPLTSSQPQMSSEPAEPAPRPAPRRTYGKARPRSPTPEPQPEPELVLPPSPKQSSPVKGLAHRWETANASWRDSLAGLDVGQEEKEDDVETVKRELERRRRETRGLFEKGANASPPPRAVSTRKDTPTADPEVAALAAAVDAADSGLTVSIDTSQATPTHLSLPPSSPPNKRALSPESSQGSTRDSERAVLDRRDADETRTSETNESVVLVKKAGRGKPKRVVVSDDESEEDEPPFPRARSRSASTTPRAAAAPARAGKRVAPSGSDSDESDDEGLDLDARLAQINADADENEKRAEREKEEREREEEKRKRAKAREAAKSADVGNIFSDDEDAGRRRKGHKRGLNQKDKRTMETDVYRAKLSRNANWNRPDVKRWGMPDWLSSAKDALQSEPASETTSEPIPEGEEITIFSSDNNRGKYGRPSGHPPSPTRAGVHKITHHAPKKGLTTNSSLTEDINVSDDDVAEPQPTTTDELMDQLRKADDAEKAEEQKQEKLRARMKAKKAFLASRGQPQTAANDSDSDLDITVEKTPVKPETKVLVPATAEAGSRDPRAAINFAAAAGRLTKAQLRTRGHSNKLFNKKQVVTETYMDVAAREPDHAGMKFRNGGARPAGMKKGRDEALSQKELDKAIFEKHKVQAQAQSRRMAKNFGEGLVLPAREVPDYEQLLASVTQAAQRQEEGEVGEDEDAEDEDYAPEGEVEDPVYSGDEGGAEDDAEDDAEDTDEEMEVDEPARQSTAPPADESDDDEATPVIKRKPKSRHTRVVRDSDDEDMPPPPMQRAPVAGPATSEDDGFGGFDLAGFGSGGGSPGFSQLFGETQMDGGGEAGAFTQMRKDGPAAFLPTQAMLPDVNISDTQIERDNALIAGVMEDEAMERALQLDRPKEMYLNEDGLYTQTKPQNMFAFTPGSRHEGSGSFDQSPTDEVDYTPYSRTQLNTQVRTQTQTQQDGMGSPTQGSRQFTRLRRRASGSVPPASRSSSPEQELEPTQIPSAQPTRNAFDLLRDGARDKSSAGQGEGKKGKRGRNEYMEDQAEESDEDNGWGWAKGPEADDEDDAEEGHAYLEELVDDQKVDEEERQKQDELAAQKLREIEAEDDKRREAEARKIAEGQHRIKKRGGDFGVSDDEDEEGGKKKRWNKKQRKALRQLKTDEGAFFPGETNSFQETYEREHMSDDDSIGDGTDPTWQQPERERSITPPPKRSAREKDAALREIVEKNRGRDLDKLDAELDAELTDIPHYGTSRAIPIDIDRGDENEGGFLISRSRALKKTATVQVDEDGNVVAHTSHSRLRSTEAWTKYIEAESKSNRKVSSGAGQQSVVRPQLGAASSGAGGGGSMSSLDGKRSAPMPHRQSTGSSTSSGIMVSRGDKFA